MQDEYESPLSELYLIDRKHVIEDAAKRVKFDGYFKFLIDFCNLIPDDTEVMEILFKLNRKKSDYKYDSDFNCINEDKAHGCTEILTFAAINYLEKTFYNELKEEILTTIDFLKLEENKINYLKSIFDNLNLYYQFLFNEACKLAAIHKAHNPSVHHEEEPISTFIELYETDPDLEKITIGEHTIVLIIHIYNHLQKITNRVKYELDSISGKLFKNDTDILPNSHKLIILHKLGLFDPLIKIKHEHNLSTNDFTKLVGNILGIHEKDSLNGFRKSLSSFGMEIIKKDYPIEVLRTKAKKQTEDYLKSLGLNTSKLKNKLQ